MSFEIVRYPSFAAFEDAIDYLEAQGCSEFFLWRGDDGLLRGHGKRPL